MGGPIASLLDISRRSLNNSSQAIRVVGNNIANASNEAYNRREVRLKDIVSANPTETSFGLGADIDGIVRRVDEFIDRLHRGTISDQGMADIRADLLSRAETPFSVDKTLRHIGFELSEYFSALQSMDLNPADNALRSNVITAGQNLTQAIRMTFETLSALQREADDRIRFVVDDINSYSEQISSLNLKISASETSDQENLGLRDERDDLLRKLAEKISFSTVEDSNGQVTVSLANGFSLVNGTTFRTLETASTPSFGSFPPRLDRGPMSTVVWDADSTVGTSHINMENLIVAGSGELAGLLKFRGVPQTGDTTAFEAIGDIPEIASRIEAIAQHLIIHHNNIYRPMEGATVLSAAPDGTRPGFLGLFGLTTSVLSDTDANQVVGQIDITNSGIRSVAAELSFTPTLPGQLAFARDRDPTVGVEVFAPGDYFIARQLFAQRTAIYNFSAGNYSENTSIENLYSDTVTMVGSLVSRAKNDAETNTSKADQLNELRTSISSVNIDEELAKLINLQRSFQASARLIRTGDELLDTLFQALG